MNASAQMPEIPPPVFDMLLRRTPVHVFLFDPDLTCRYAAPVGDHFFGRRREDLVGHTAREILPLAAHDLCPTLERVAQERFACGHPGYQFTVHTTEGVARQAWAVDVQPMAVSGYRGVLLSWADLTDLVDERDRLQTEVVTLRGREEERQRALGELLADLRSMLAPPLGFLQVIVKRPHVLRGRSAASTIAEEVLPRMNEFVEALGRLRDPHPRGADTV